MQKPASLLVLFSLFFFRSSLAQLTDQSIADYINTYRDIAISEMQRTGIPAAIKLAQGIHETEAGTSVLVKKSNNHFGLKCKTEWTGMTVKHTDDAPNECFRKYERAEDSYRDQSDYLRNTPRYASLFQLDPTDYKGWATGLKKAGYATNPKYTQVLIKLIEDYHLQDYTLIAMGKMKPTWNDVAKTEVKLPENNVIAASEVKPAVIMQQPGTAKTPAKNGSVSQEIKKEIKPEYPDGEFKINETKVIYAKSGTSFLSIAQSYNIPLARIFEFNDMKEKETVEGDQLIYIMRKRKTGLNEQHVVKEGETLEMIAQTEALRMESLMEYNYLQTGMKPITGAVLYLRSKAPAQPALVTGK